jgi:hypothetical protein
VRKLETYLRVSSTGLPSRIPLQRSASIVALPGQFSITHAGAGTSHGIQVRTLYTTAPEAQIMRIAVGGGIMHWPHSSLQGRTPLKTAQQGAAA